MQNKIDLFYDLFDQACMILYEDLSINYVEAIIRVASDITKEINESKLSIESVNKLNDIYEVIRNESFSNEDVRLALQLLIIKGFKHIEYNLNIMTPDTINYLFCYIISKIYNKKDFSIIDTALGTNNTLSTILNYPDLNCLKAVGIEDDGLLVHLSEASSNLQDNEEIIYYNDALNDILDICDIVIGDLDSYNHDKGYLGIKYYPYGVILKRLSNIKDNGFFLYLINNDFFQKEEMPKFKSELDKDSTLLGLIVLPSSSFSKDHIGKSIIIGQKKKYDKYDIAIQKINSFENKEQLQNNLNSLKQWLEKINK